MRIKFWLLIFALILGMLFSLGPDYYFYGIKDISANKMIGDSYKIEIKCNDYRQYEVTNVDNDEKAYCGEKLLSINQDLGKNIIKVHLFDSADPDESFYSTYRPWTTYELSGSDNQLRFMYCYSDHGVLIYIGSDSFKYYEKSMKKLDSIVIIVSNDESDS